MFNKGINDYTVMHMLCYEVQGEYTSYGWGVCKVIIM